jgi:hypothetical protein
VYRVNAQLQGPVSTSSSDILSVSFNLANNQTAFCTHVVPA